MNKSETSALLNIIDRAQCVGMSVQDRLRPLAATNPHLAPHVHALINAVQEHDLPADEQVQYLLKMLAQAVYTNPLLTWKPYPYQLKFFASDKPEVLLAAGNQTGKTTAGLAGGLMRCLDIHPYQRYGRPVKIIFGVPTEKTALDSTIPKLEALIPWNRVVRWGDTVRARFANQCRFDNGSIFSILTYRMGREAWQSHTVDVIYADEEFDRDIFHEMQLRVARRDGSIRMTMTALNTLQTPDKAMWFAEHYKKARDSGLMDVINASCYDCPGMPPHVIPRILAEHSNLDGTLTEEGRARLYGEIIIGGGLCVFPVQTIRKQIDELHNNLKPPVFTGSLVYRAIEEENRVETAA
jgi:phage terminase large subunit-like protein